MMQKAEYKITLMTEETVRQVAAIAAACFSTPWSEGAYQRELTNPQAITLVAVCNDCVVGFVNCGFVVDELTVNALAVLPAYRRMGIAAALMQALFAWMEGVCSVCYLEVRESNVPAQQLYGSLGFVQNGYRAQYYDEPAEAAILMMKQL